MHDLPCPMHTRVGTPGTEDTDRFVRHLRERFFQLFLDAAHLILALPAIIFTAVVLNAEGNFMDWLQFHI
jgi:hypothetical protein